MVKHVKNRSQLRDVVNMGQNLSKVKMCVHFCWYVFRKYYDFLSNIVELPPNSSLKSVIKYISVKLGYMPAFFFFFFFFFLLICPLHPNYVVMIINR